MSKSKGFMGHYGLSYALDAPENQVKEKIIKLSEVEKRRLRFQLKEKAKIGRQKEDERRERYYK